MYFPAEGVTKGEVLAYYHEIAPVLLPHLRDRPLTLERYPEGVEGESFYQKDTPAHYPDWLRTYSKKYRHSERVTHHPLVDDAADLLYLANLGVLTFHTFLSRTADIEHPDLLVIDIDPPSDPDRESVPQSFAKAREAAHVLRAELERSGLDPLVKTSGKRGLHLALPLDGTLDFAEIREVLSGLFEKAIAAHPSLVTREVSKGKKRSRVYLDALRMALGATVVAPYAVRPTPIASVSMPVTWEELDELDDPYLFTVRTAGERVAAVGDLWNAIHTGDTIL
ncbi:MAG: ATP-dependent DNA ligase [Actinobacteria bacterium]|nr:ATP-dependent DNA ligase [Actinomycetota bacterium]